MQHRKLGFVLFALAAAGGCTFNGKSLFKLGGSSPSSSSSSSGGGGGSGSSSEGSGGTAARSVRAPASYAWCKQLKEEYGATDASSIEEALDPARSPGRALPGILQGLCFPSEASRAKRNELEAARQLWMKRLAADEQGWATDIVAWGNLRYEERMDALQRTVHPKGDVAWSAAGPLEQWALLRARGGDSAAFHLAPGAYYYIADALPLTEAGRIGFIERCIAPGNPNEDPNPVDGALCREELAALDMGKLSAELTAESARPLHERMALRYAVSQVVQRAPKHAEAMKQLAARDPAYAALFELAKSVRKQWAAPTAPRAELLAAVSALDDARATGSRKALEGCSARVWPLFAAAAGRLPAKRFEGMRGDAESAQTFFDVAIGAITQDPDTYLAANALFACEGSGDHLTGALGLGLSYWAGFRGPRTATLTAVRLAGLEPDKRGEKIEIPTVAVPLGIARKRPARAEESGSAIGVIASVKDQGSTVRVTFPSSSELQEQCASRRTTNRISRIDSSGNLHYETVCTSWKTVRVDTTLRPVEVPKRYAAGLAPKRFVSIIGGVPEAVWSKPNSPAPLAAFGALLK